MKTPARSFTDLDVWQNAHALVLEVYRLTEGFPDHERYGLASQLRRSAVSVPADIAEGFRKYSSADKARFINIAEGSLEESRYYCILAQDLGYGQTASVLEKMDIVAGQLGAYVRRLRQSGAQRK
ncbi:MAG: four helix bundle protein [Syntrophobacteraceae bacterium]|nr:four helix bundle protein [Syntrophobacteraceae bacterium]